jgi:DNA-binding transcriptional LysR family regulator
VALDVLLPLPEEICRQRLGVEWLVVVVRRRHPKVRAKLDLDTYLAQEHIAVSSRRRGLSAEDFELGRHTLRRRIRLRCQSYFAACHVVRRDQPHFNDAHALCPHPQHPIWQPASAISPQGPGVRSYLYWHANAEADPANAWLRQQLLQSLRNSAFSARQTR